jgi:hypothetical protein
LTKDDGKTKGKAMGFQSDWFFNSDESEKPGKGAHDRMISQSCVAAWGDCRGKGADELLVLPSAGDGVFLYRVGFGMVVMAIFDDHEPLPSRSVFNEQGEYHRTVGSLLILPQANILSSLHILQETGYHVPARQILCRIHDAGAAAFMKGYFRRHGIDAARYSAIARAR